MHDFLLDFTYLKISWSLIRQFPNTHYIWWLPQVARSCELKNVRWQLSVWWSRSWQFWYYYYILRFHFFIFSYWFNTEADISLLNAYTGRSKGTGMPQYILNGFSCQYFTSTDLVITFFMVFLWVMKIFLPNLVSE